MHAESNPAALDSLGVLRARGCVRRRVRHPQHVHTHRQITEALLDALKGGLPAVEQLEAEFANSEPVASDGDG